MFVVAVDVGLAKDQKGIEAVGFLALKINNGVLRAPPQLRAHNSPEVTTV